MSTAKDVLFVALWLALVVIATYAGSEIGHAIYMAIHACPGR